MGTQLFCYIKVNDSYIYFLIKSSFPVAVLYTRSQLAEIALELADNKEPGPLDQESTIYLWATGAVMVVEFSLYISKAFLLLNNNIILFFFCSFCFSYGISTWMCTDIEGGQTFREEILANVRDAKVFLIFLNQEWAECVFEYNYAMVRH